MTIVNGEERWVSREIRSKVLADEAPTPLKKQRRKQSIGVKVVEPENCASAIKIPDVYQAPAGVSGYQASRKMRSAQRRSAPKCINNLHLPPPDKR